MVSRAEVLAAEWKLLRVEISAHDDSSGIEAYDGFSRFWSKQAVLGAYWVAERLDDATIRLHVTDDLELEGFQEALSFEPDDLFKQELLASFNWDEIIQEVFPVVEKRPHLTLVKDAAIDNRTEDSAEDGKGNKDDE